MSEWISVKDRLPPDDEPVLVYHEDDDHITLGEFEKTDIKQYFHSDGSQFFYDDGWSSQIPWAQKGRVTHWMPLPLPPTTEVPKLPVSLTHEWLCQRCGKWELNIEEMCYVGKCDRCSRVKFPVFPVKIEGLSNGK